MAALRTSSTCVKSHWLHFVLVLVFRTFWFHFDFNTLIAHCTSSTCIKRLWLCFWLQVVHLNNFDCILYFNTLIAFFTWSLGLKSHRPQKRCTGIYLDSISTTEFAEGNHSHKTKTIQRHHRKDAPASTHRSWRSGLLVLLHWEWHQENLPRKLTAENIISRIISS